MLLGSSGPCPTEVESILLSRSARALDDRWEHPACTYPERILLWPSWDEAWQDVRDRMRIPNEQTIISAVDWISDPWIAKGIEVAGFLPTAAPIWKPPDQVDA